MNEDRITMLGTGSAFVTKCYNACFVLEGGGSRLLVDAGGGNGILSQMEKADLSFADLHAMFITHAHTDHILGTMWVMRMIIRMVEHGEYSGIFNVYGNSRVVDVLNGMCRLLLSSRQMAHIGREIVFNVLHDGENFQAGAMMLTCFDIHSTKEQQFGFKAVMPEGETFTCLGDEPFHEQNLCYAEGSDWLLHEAFCLYGEREDMKPYEKSHSTAMDAGENARRLGVGNLILYHTADNRLGTKKADYTADAARRFEGNVYVPDDLEKISLAIRPNSPRQAIV